MYGQFTGPSGGGVKFKARPKRKIRNPLLGFRLVQGGGGGGAVDPYASPELGPTTDEGLSTGAIVAIAGASVLLLGGGAWLLLRGRSGRRRRR